MASEIKLANKQYRLGHPLAAYLGELINLKALSYVLPPKWNLFSPREMFNEIVNRLYVSILNGSYSQDALFIQECSLFISNQVAHIALTTDKEIVSTSANSGLSLLHAAIFKANVACIAAKDHVELEDAKLSPNLLAALDAHSTALGVLTDWVHSFVRLYSSNETGKLDKSSCWNPMSVDVAKSLNV